MAQQFSPTLDADLGANPHRVVSSTVQQARDWITAELEAWGLPSSMTEN